MKLWIISDIHLEFGEPFLQTPRDDVDVLVCAGDVLTKGLVPSLRWLADTIAREIPVIFVAGNHDFYGASIEESIRDSREFAAGFSNVHFLENDAVEIGGVRFIGGTLWTDFRLFGRNPSVSMSYAESGMNDFKKIKFSKAPYRKFKPIHAYRKHIETRDFIAADLRKHTRPKSVVVTHHAPSPRAIALGFRHDPLSACYASDLEDLITEAGPTLWVHGHVHHRNDYIIGSTRVVSNSRGYPGEATGFDPTFTIKI
ncbi:phosphatase [Rhizobium sp. SEMIA 4085]|uniref:Calcineurin-like phosphoesterase domain-containing protein n=1 Tax=Rhizobium gallicum bv. gallicum R602sp TaxID=1041138 RepID=A0A0B4X181_9HYPH|nr:MULTISPECIES: metallophosphoesterase [Rhizobium]AJD41704.1 calcineurin-like phosphoesterase domain-containing protein [Rhizobium gallicum bv. gallicum R602sp]NNH32469.1 phosphatase [Rhizobium sp. SEMIA 4085]